MWLWPNNNVLVLVTQQQWVLLIQALTEGEDSKTTGLGWLKWRWVVALKCPRTLPYVGYLATYWALHGATFLVLFPNANGQIIRNSQLFSLGMDGNNVSALAACLDIIHLAWKRLKPRTKSVLRFRDLTSLAVLEGFLWNTWLWEGSSSTDTVLKIWVMEYCLAMGLHCHHLQERCDDMSSFQPEGTVG